MANQVETLQVLAHEALHTFRAIAQAKNANIGVTTEPLEPLSIGTAYAPTNTGLSECISHVLEFQVEHGRSITATTEWNTWIDSIRNRGVAMFAAFDPESKLSIALCGLSNGEVEVYIPQVKTQGEQA
jgi:hypothetical protein